MKQNAIISAIKKLGCLGASVIFSVFGCFSLFACKPKAEYTPLPPRVYEIEDPLNEKGMSYWSSLPFITAEAKQAGYAGSGACQHLTFLERAPLDKNVLYFGTDAAGVWRSFDGRSSWKPCIKGLFTSGVCGIEVDPKNTKHVVCVNAASSVVSSKYTALFYSFDGGDMWYKGDGTRGIGYAASQYDYDTLEIDPRSYDAALGYCTDVYFCTPAVRDSFPSAIRDDETYFQNRGMYKSTDGGKSYSKIDGTDELTDGIVVITDLGVCVANMNGIFILNGDKYVKKSDMNVYSFTNVAQKYYIMTEQGIFTSADLNSFTRITSDDFFTGRFPRDLAVSEKNPERMVLFARKRANTRYSERPYYSHDGGATWTLGELLTTPELFYYYTYHSGLFSFDPDDENVILGIIGGEVIKSTDGGANFSYSGSGVSNVSVGGFFNFNVYNEDIVYMGAYDFGGALTLDGGKTWKNISLSKDADGKDIMGGYAADENTLFGVYAETWTSSEYFRDYRYVCYSHDGGKTVNIKESVIESEPQTYDDLHVDTSIQPAQESSYQSPNNKNILFCANYRSTDYGYTWKNMQDVTKGEKCLQVYTHCGKTLYGCSKRSGFVLKSDDDGATWSKVNSEELPKWRASAPSHITDIAVDGKNGYIYVAFADKLFRMKLDGTEITDLNQNMAKNNYGTYRIRSVAVDKNIPEIVYICGSGDFYRDVESVRRSIDCGESWKTVTPSESAQSIVHDGSSLGYEGRCVRVRSNGIVWCSTLCLGVCTLTPPYTV